MGPTTTPEIQILLLDVGLGITVCSVGCGVLDVEDAALMKVAARLEDDDTVCADIIPVDLFSTTILFHNSLSTYCSTARPMC